MQDLSRLLRSTDSLAKDLQRVAENRNDGIYSAAAGMLLLVHRMLEQRIMDEHKAITERN